VPKSGLSEALFSVGCAPPGFGSRSSKYLIYNGFRVLGCMTEFDILSPGQDPTIRNQVLALERFYCPRALTTKTAVNANQLEIATLCSACCPAK
jgi:hypothetical protein